MFDLSAEPLPLPTPTKRIVINHAKVGPYIARNAKCPFNPETDNTIGIVRIDPLDPSKDEVLGGVLFTAHSVNASIWMHMAGEGTNWATPTFLWAVFDYPFNQLGVRRVYGIVEKANELAVRVDQKLGFQIMDQALPYMFASGDALIVYMEREMCRWLKVRPRSLRARGDGID